MGDRSIMPAYHQYKVRRGGWDSAGVSELWTDDIQSCGAWIHSLRGWLQSQGLCPSRRNRPLTQVPKCTKWKSDICISDWPQSFCAKRHFLTLRLYVCDPWRTLLLIWVLLVFLAGAKNEWPCREYPTLWRVQGSWNDSVSWFASLENSGVLIFWNLAVHFEGSLAFMGDILCMTYLSSVPVPLVFIVLRNLLRGPIFYRLWLTGNTKKHCGKPPKSKQSKICSA